MPGNPNPSDLLKQLEDQLAADQSKSSALTQEMTDLKSQIADLTKAVAAITQVTSAWDKVSQTVAQRQKDFNSYIVGELRILDAAVQNKADVAALKTAAEKKLNDLATAVQNARANEAAQQQALQTARDTATSKKKAYDNLAQLADADDAVLKHLTALQANSDKAKAANQLSHEYFWILLVEDVIQRLQTPSSQQYADQLNAAASDKATASAAEVAAKNVADKATSDRQQAEQDLAAWQTTWGDVVAAQVQEGIGNAGAAAAVAPPIVTPTKTQGTASPA